MLAVDAVDGVAVAAVHAATEGEADSGLEIRDALPEDLNATEYVGPYQFPDIKRRRIPGAMYLVMGIVMVVLYLTTRSGDPVNVSKGFGVGGLVLIVIGAYHLAAGWHLAIDQTAALGAASRQIGFPVGHASAQLGWRGLLSRPTWRILLYSAENPPAKRGLVLIDAVDSSVVGSLVHDNPEDWSEYDT